MEFQFFSGHPVEYTLPQPKARKIHRTLGQKIKNKKKKEGRKEKEREKIYRARIGRRSQGEKVGSVSEKPLYIAVAGVAGGSHLAARAFKVQNGPVAT